MHLTRIDPELQSKEGSMFGISDAHHFRKMVAGFCMLFAPLCMLVGFLVDPDAEYAFLFAGAVLMVPAALGLMHMLREREVALGHVGGGLSLVGLMGMAALIGMDVATWQAAGSAVTDTATIVHRVDHIDGIATAMFIGSL